MSEGVEEAGCVGFCRLLGLHPAVSTSTIWPLRMWRVLSARGWARWAWWVVMTRVREPAPPSLVDGPGSEVGEELDHVEGGGGVEVGEGLVEEEELGVGLEDSGEGGALAHALGVLADGAGEVGVEADGAEGHLGRAYAGAAAVAVKRGEVGEVLHGGELVVEHGGVAHVGDAAALVVGRLREDRYGAAGGGDETGDEAEEGGFAGSVFAEDDGGGSGGEGGRDVAEGGEGAVDLGDGIQLRSGLEGAAAGCRFRLGHDLALAVLAGCGKSRWRWWPGLPGLRPGRTWRRIWPGAGWRGRRRRAHRCLQRGPGRRP